jgi:DNA-directed RNA polymerase subunit RPC12/RpoP
VCRYAYAGPYKDRYACFACRKAFKRRKPDDLPAPMRPSTDATKPTIVRCPDCGQPMHNMGMDFKAPRRADVRQWRKVQILFTHGFTFHSCGCGPGLRPVALREVPAFLNDKLPKSKGELLLQRFARCQQGTHHEGQRRTGQSASRPSGRLWGPVFPPRRPPARRRAVEPPPPSTFTKPPRKR